MIKSEVLSRNQVYTIYSSERQERMKVYFELNDEFKKCVEACPIVNPELRLTCSKNCEKIYDKYSDLLHDRYKSNKERLDMEVKNLPPFTTREREDRKGLFYKIFGY